MLNSLCPLIIRSSKQLLNQPKLHLLTIVNQYQRGVKLTFGKYAGTLEPGIRLNLPIVHQIWKVNMSEEVEEIPKQSLISIDDVTLHIDASVQYKVIDPAKAIIN